MAKKKPKSTCSMNGCCSGKEGFLLLVSEAALFGFLYYIQYLLKIQTNLWLSSLILIVLLNISIWTCPVVRKSFCQ